MQKKETSAYNLLMGVCYSGSALLMNFALPPTVCTLTLPDLADWEFKPVVELSHPENVTRASAKCPKCGDRVQYAEFVWSCDTPGEISLL